MNQNPIKTTHWQTQRLVEVLSDLKVGEPITYQDLAKACETTEQGIRQRLASARSIALRDHHVIIETVRGVGVIRLGQEDVARPVARKRDRIRSAARGGRKLIASGVTDWEKLPAGVKTQLLTDSAVLGAIIQATDHNTRKKLVQQVEANGELNIGRTLELMK